MHQTRRRLGVFILPRLLVVSAWRMSKLSGVDYTAGILVPSCCGTNDSKFGGFKQHNLNVLSSSSSSVLLSQVILPKNRLRNKEVIDGGHAPRGNWLGRDRSG